jgi:hypothetical protein
MYFLFLILLLINYSDNRNVFTCIFLIVLEIKVSFIFAHNLLTNESIIMWPKEH